LPPLEYSLRGLPGRLSVLPMCPLFSVSESCKVSLWFTCADVGDWIMSVDHLEFLMLVLVVDVSQKQRGKTRRCLHW
jgi:hypothetical protein